MNVSYMAIPAIKGGKIVKMIFGNNSSFPDNVIKTVCKFYEQGEDLVMSKTRKGEVVLCRHVIAYLLKIHTNMTDDEIGKKLCKDRSTIIHAVKSIRNWMRNEPYLTEEISTIRAMLVCVDN